jgi:hypothetical protein
VPARRPGSRKVFHSLPPASGSCPSLTLCSACSSASCSVRGCPKLQQGMPCAAHEGAEVCTEESVSSPIKQGCK